jgi:hypothetical protein
VIAHPLAGTEVEFRCAPELEFFFDPRAISLHRGLAEIQCLGDVVSALAATQKLEDLQLSISE